MIKDIKVLVDFKRSFIFLRECIGHPIIHGTSGNGENVSFSDLAFFYKSLWADTGIQNP